MLLAISKFVTTPHVATAGGYFGLFTAFNAWYVAAAGLLTPDTSYFTLPIGSLARD
jgi:succinate-acetate transporter protein